MTNEIIVTGGRNYRDQTTVFEILNQLKPTLVIQGGAYGTDALAVEWCRSCGVKCITVKANWSLGKRASSLRNKKMLEDFPNAIIVAFPGNNGTRNCVMQAEMLGRIIIRIPPA